MIKLSLEKRLNELEHTHRRAKTVETMTDRELCKIIGINDPSNDELMRIAGGEI